MVSSLYKKWSTIVRLLPCSKSSAKGIFPIIKTVIGDIENCNLKVQAICTDNYPMNVSLFKLFSPTDTLDTVVPHPLISQRWIVLLFDFVHILKSIRNNWLNQTDYNCTFLYPNFEDFNSTNKALFEDIRLLFRSEQNSVAKLAHRLTAKSCWPSNLERQNVSLAQRIFNESTAAALTIQNSSRTEFKSDTAEFITIISNLWKIFNVNTPNKGTRLKDVFSHPLVNNDPIFCYLDRIVDWLERWKDIPEKKGKLSAQTFTSLRHSCKALPKIVNHLTQNCGFYFVLSSFLQTDPLKHHFGLYRMMAGAQYHITYCQILETERRIKLSNIIKLLPRKRSIGHLSLKEFLGTFSSFDYQRDSSIDLEHYLSEIQNIDDIEIDISSLQSIVFIAGYAVHKYLIKWKNCTECRFFLTEDKDLHIEEPLDSKYKLVEIIDRGSLEWPSDTVIESILILWTTFKKIEQVPEVCDAFLIGPSLKILVELTIQLLETQRSEDWRNTCPNCETIGWFIIRKFITSTSNCLLSNKTKNMNALQASYTDNVRKLKKLKSN